MIGDLGVPELLIILVLVVLLFGAGRVGRLGKDLGTSIREFRKAMSEEDGERSGAGAEGAQHQVSTPGLASLDVGTPEVTHQNEKPPSLF